MSSAPASHLLKMYNPFPFEVEKAVGTRVYSRDGKEYIDTFSGIGVLSFGHSYGPLIDVMREKMGMYMHMSNFFSDPDAEIVAGLLLKYTGRDGSVFFTNSGTEATEAALKAIGRGREDERQKIVCFTEGFHGRTLGALALNGFEKYRKPFRSMLFDANELPFNDPHAFENFMKREGDSVCAVFLEPVQGSGGVVPISEAMARKIMELKRVHRYLVVSDEIQSGLGRTGEVYSYQNAGLEPDIVTVGKSIGGGLPLGAAIFLGETAGYLKFGDHGSTFAPNPVALAGARFVMENMPAMLPEVRKKGEFFLSRLSAACGKKLADIRGRGLMIGALLAREDEKLRERAFEKENLLLNVLGNRLIRLLPPLNIPFEEIDAICEKLGRAIE